MSHRSRRRFLRDVATAGVAVTAVSADQLVGTLLSAQTAAVPATTPARLYVDTRRTRATLDRNIFGSFLEHLGRAIYEGIYEPGSKLSDSDGYRKDVLDEIQQLNV